MGVDDQSIFVFWVLLMKLKSSNGLVNQRVNFVPWAMRAVISFFIPIRTFRAFITIVIQRQHLLITLLALEGVILTLSFIVRLFYRELFFILILLTFGACEASLGLACLVSITRRYGNDLFNSLISAKC